MLFFYSSGFVLYHSVLLTASPNPGVSTMVSLSLTPFSSMSTVCLVISTVCVILSEVQTHPGQWTETNIYSTKPRLKGCGFLTFSIEQFPIFVEICEKQAVDQSGLPQTRLPFKKKEQQNQTAEVRAVFLTMSLKLKSSLKIRFSFKNSNSPATMRVKSNPFFTDLRCTWFGKVANPTYSLSWS